MVLVLVVVMVADTDVIDQPLWLLFNNVIVYKVLIVCVCDALVLARD